MSRCDFSWMRDSTAMSMTHSSEIRIFPPKLEELLLSITHYVTAMKSKLMGSFLHLMAKILQHLRDILIIYLHTYGHICINIHNNDKYIYISYIYIVYMYIQIIQYNSAVNHCIRQPPASSEAWGSWKWWVWWLVAGGSTPGYMSTIFLTWMNTGRFLINKVLINLALRFLLETE